MMNLQPNTRHVNSVAMSRKSTVRGVDVVADIPGALNDIVAVALRLIEIALPVVVFVDPSEDAAIAIDALWAEFLLDDRIDCLTHGRVVGGAHCLDEILTIV